jgi:hypothetical protein
MATWTTVPDSSLEPGKPIRSIDALALRDNPVAIAEGAAGAPRILSFALEPLDAGDVIRSRDDGEITNSSTFYELVASWSFMQYGSVRIYMELRVNAGTTSAQVRRTRNGSTVTLATLANSHSTYASRTADVSVEMGDKVEIYFRNDNFGGIAYIRNKRLQTSGAKWWPATSGAVE